MLPRCCGKKMTASVETTKFVEALCKKCGDVVYIKKEQSSAPQMIDD